MIHRLFRKQSILDLDMYFWNEKNISNEFHGTRDGGRNTNIISFFHNFHNRIGK